MDKIDTIDTILTLIAKKHIGIETLEPRNSDRLDFHDIGATSLKNALQAAFMSGCELGIAVQNAELLRIRNAIQSVPIQEEKSFSERKLNKLIRP